MQEEHNLTDRDRSPGGGRTRTASCPPTCHAGWRARSRRSTLFSLWTGKLVCWLILPLIFAMVYEIVARYYFIAPTIWAYDISRMVYGAHFMLGAAYALSKGVHIRSDFLYRDWSVRRQAAPTCCSISSSTSPRC